MTEKIEHLLPNEIEQRSFRIISQELGNRLLDKEQEPIIKRVIHTTADFDYVENLYFSPNAVSIAKKSLKEGINILTDTQMAKAGINKKVLAQWGGEVFCFMSDEDVAQKAVENHTTRAAASIEKAANFPKPFFFVVGNAPTALIRIYELVKESKIKPAFIVGAPVGFVNVVQAKELILELEIPCIVARGRKGGSNVAAAICNALLYELKKECK